jgi:CRP-like cAMP-binding protein
MTAVTFLPLKQATSQSPVYSFNPRSSIDDRANLLWKVESGFVRTVIWLEDGTLIVLGIWGAGD